MSQQTLNQLKRIQGQIQGVIKMYEEDRECVDVVRQVIATRNSLTRVARDLLFGEAQKCTKERRIEDLDALLSEMFKY